MAPSSAVLLHELRRLSCPPSDAELLRRWTGQREEDAFAALVARHGRMVLGVCRRLLGNSHDAEDVFQATFLVLAERGASLRQPEALAGWLHGVALRLARKARTAAARRRCAALPASSPEPCDPVPEPLDLLSARELLELIDREIARLPEVNRQALVLCDLEERGLEEAAGLLGWTPGSLRGRLVRGRKRLRERLARRGLAPALLSAVLASGLTRGKADAALASLVARTSRLAVLGESCARKAQLPVGVATLVREGVWGGLLCRLKVVSALLLMVATIAGGTGLLAQHVRSPQAGPEDSKSVSPSSRVDTAREPRRDQQPAGCDPSGDPLPKEALARLGTTRFRHGGRIESLGFTPDGKTIVSGGEGIVRVWDAATGKESRTLEQMSVQYSTLSPDGRLLAVRRHDTGTKDSAIEIRAFDSGRLLCRFGEQQTPPQLLFSPDGKVLAAFRWGKKIELWSPTGGRLLHTLAGHEDIVWSIAFSADGKTLVSVSDDRTLRLWDVATGKEVRRIRTSEHVYLVALSPDGKLIATIAATRETWQGGGGTSWHPQNRVRLWDATTGKELRQLAPAARVPAPRTSDRLMALAFSPDGKLLVSGGLDGVLRFWDPASGQQLRQVAGFAGSPTALTFAPDGKSLALGDALSVRRIDVRTGKDLAAGRGHSSVVSSLSMLPDGQRAATSSYAGPLCIWSTRSGRLLCERAAGETDSAYCSLTPDGRTSLVLEEGDRLRIQELATGKELAAFHAPGVSFPVALSPDRKLLAAVGPTNALRLLETAGGKVRHTLSQGKERIRGMAFSANGSTLVVWSEDLDVSIWDVAAGERLRQFSVGHEEGRRRPRLTGASEAALSADGKLLALGLELDGSPPVILVVDTASGKPACRFSIQGYSVACLAFSPDGKSLAWGCPNDSRAHLGEIATGRERHRFSGHQGTLSALSFSADGKTLLSGAMDTTALVWDLTGRLAAGEKGNKPLSGDDVKRHWETLCGDDPSAAYRAIQALAADPPQAVPLLEQHLRPVPGVRGQEERLKRWIADLDSSDFDVRERASKELDRQGEAALPALREALADPPSLEVRRRLEQLVRKHERGEWSLTAEQVRDSRALEVLERIGTPQAQRSLAKVAAGMPGAWRTRQAQASLERVEKRFHSPP